jgi:hypothetical protein
LVLREQARVEKREPAEIREIFGRRRRTPASADADEKCAGVGRCR